uniref:phosphoglycerate kinase n=1 Tax=Salibaculum sp. TaxID=2855480 RepID=UPI00286FBD20|nr:phosphoglycerate kinase [Salibaculum sp.]
MELPRTTDMEVAGKRVLVRADLNVPIEDGRITDATRIERFAHGMRPLLDKGARLVILTHYGRPDPNERNPGFSVDKLRPALSEALGTRVDFSDVCIGRSARILSEKVQPGEALLCENLRYNAGETANDPDFAAGLAGLGDIYVNDAFSCAHRAHASTEALAHLLPAAAGPLMLEEIEALTSALENPASPSVAVVGGSKVSTKIAVLRNLVAKIDHLIVGGGMANTFLFAEGAPMGRSLHEADQLDMVAEIRRAADAAGCQLHIPVDAVAAAEFASDTSQVVCDAHACPEDMMMLDAGPKALAAFETLVAEARTVLWNGPLGAFELSPFDHATLALARAVAQRTQAGAVTSVAGGGDTVAALNAAGVVDDFTYVSSAGGAFLEWLEGRTLPGITALKKGAQHG